MLNLIGLLDLDAYPYAVDTRFDEDSLVLVARDGQWRQQDLRRALSFDLWYVMTLCRL
jgi:hypothetical protein